MASFDQKLRTLYLMEILPERTDDDTHAKCIANSIMRNGQLRRR